MTQGKIVNVGGHVATRSLTLVVTECGKRSGGCETVDGGGEGAKGVCACEKSKNRHQNLGSKGDWRTVPRVREPPKTLFWVYCASRANRDPLSGVLGRGVAPSTRPIPT